MFPAAEQSVLCAGSADSALMPPKHRLHGDGGQSDDEGRFFTVSDCENLLMSLSQHSHKFVDL